MRLKGLTAAGVAAATTMAGALALAQSAGTTLDRMVLPIPQPKRPL